MASGIRQPPPRLIPARGLCYVLPHTIPCLYQYCDLSKSALKGSELALVWCFRKVISYIHYLSYLKVKYIAVLQTVTVYLLEHTDA